MRPFTLQYASPGRPTDTVAPYRFDAVRQLNVLPDGRLATSDTGLLLTAGTTTSTAGSQTHSDD
ncbi:putative ATP-grasp-modified RiPP [Streptomyces broussonetiae]|uniref:ATP-grasp-modified RiPP n=1 Tax=Streptomyces broussonetiae TaxID=2686304 RepID=A0ABV5ELG4_9ACTN